MQSNILPEKPLTDISKRIATDFFTIYLGAKSISIRYALNQSHLKGLDNSGFEASYARPTAELTSSSPELSLSGEYICWTAWRCPILVGGIMKSFEIKLETKNTVLVSRGLGAHQILKSPLEQSMISVHDKVIRLLEVKSHANSRSLGLNLAQFLFKVADEHLPSTCISDVEVEIYCNKSNASKGNDLCLQDFDHVLINMSGSDCGNIQDMEVNRSPSRMDRVYVALGSNVGDRLAMIETACRDMNSRGIRVLRTSSLYETEPMYFEDQPPFLNGVCEVSIRNLCLTVFILSITSGRNRTTAFSTTQSAQSY